MEVVVSLADGRELVVRSEADDIVLGLRGGWSQQLKRDEAWELAEAIDRVSTAATDRLGPDAADVTPE